MKGILLLHIILCLPLLTISQQSKIADLIETSVKSELQSRYENGSLTDTTYIMLDMWNVDVSDFSSIQPPYGMIVWMSMKNIDYNVINKGLPFIHVSINIEGREMAVYLQSGLGIRYDGPCQRYGYPLIMDSTDCTADNVWLDIIKVFLSSNEENLLYPEVMPVIFGKYKYCYQIELMDIPSSVNGVMVKPLSEFVKSDDSYYFNFEDDFMGVPFVVMDISYNKDNNLMVYLRNVVLSVGYIFIANGIYPHTSYSVFELSFDEATGFRIQSYYLDQKNDLSSVPDLQTGTSR